MELSDYWHLIRKWGLLVIAGTVLAAVVGYGITRLQHRHARTTYDATATVLVNYTAPPTVPYGQQPSPRTVVNTLSNLANDATALRTVANTTHVGSPEVTTVTADVSPDVPEVTVHAVGSDPLSARTFANGMAQYMARTENQSVNGQARSLRRGLKPQVTAAYRAWHAAQQHYYFVCGCLPNTAQKVDTATLAGLKTNLDLLLQKLQTLQNQYDDLSMRNAPAAAGATPGTVTKISPARASLTKTVLPAAILGLILSIGLAALLDYMRTVPEPFARRIGPWRRQPGVARSRVPVLGSIAEAKLNLDKRQRRQTGFPRGGAEPQLQRQILDALGGAGAQVAEVLSRLAGSGQRTIYITSPSRREAKVQSVLSIAVALVRTHQRVILVDADPSAGGLSAFFGFERSPGLTDYVAYPSMSLPQLLHTVDVGEVGQHGRLSFLPLGLHPDALAQHPSQGASSSTPASLSKTWNGEQATPQESLNAETGPWSSLFADLGGSSSIVLVNGAPALESPAALALAPSATGTLLVVRRRHVDYALTQAREVLQGVGAHLLGIVINADDRSLKRFPALEGAGHPSPLAARAESAVSWHENTG